MDKAFWKEKADNEIAIGLLLTPFRSSPGDPLRLFFDNTNKEWANV